MCDVACDARTSWNLASAVWGVACDAQTGWNLTHAGYCYYLGYHCLITGP